MPWDQPTRLRGLLGDTLVEGADPFFADDQIQALLTEFNGDLQRAAYEGWQMKAASYADLITVTEGNAQRQMSDLIDHAMKMVRFYEGAQSNAVAGRARVGRIIRRV